MMNVDKHKGNKPEGVKATGSGFTRVYSKMMIAYLRTEYGYKEKDVKTLTGYQLEDLIAVAKRMTAKPETSIPVISAAVRG